MSTTTQSKTTRDVSADEEADLSEGWCSVAVKDIATVRGGKRLPKGSVYADNQTNRPYIRVTDFEAFSISGDDLKFLTEDTHRKIARYTISTTDVYISIAGSIGKVGLVPASLDGANLTENAAKLTCSVGVTREYLCFALNAPFAQKQIEHSITSSGQPKLALFRIEQLSLPLPPLPEQKRIVAKIEELFKQVNASRERLAKVPQILKYFRQSVLAAACSGRLSEDWRVNNPTARVESTIGEGEPPEEFELPKSWNWLLSSHEFAVVTSGSRGWARYYADDGPTFIRVGNLNHGSIEIDLRSVQNVRPPSAAEGMRTRVMVGDILISITADVGMIALVDRDLGEAYINQHVALARPRGNVDRRYVAYFLASANGGQKQFQNLQRGATKVGLGLDDIRSIWIARPPIEEQQEIVRRVEALFKLADMIEKRVEAATKRADKLTQAILAKAFRGELVPTEAELAQQEGRDYEPASALLERIKSDREKSTVPKNNEKRPRRSAAKKN